MVPMVRLSGSQGRAVLAGHGAHPEVESQCQDLGQQYGCLRLPVVRHVPSTVLRGMVQLPTAMFLSVPTSTYRGSTLPLEAT